uniref:EF-hand domain-containing protein n=1 Tax=Acrobeloides nanus TaxID=290746 RepID=A0A914DCF9_9BILA
MSIIRIQIGESNEEPHLSEPNEKPSKRKLTYGKSIDVEDEHALFKSLDNDNDGFIPLKELTEAILISTDLFGLTSSQAEELIRDVDVNKDNKIDFPEFCTLMARAKKMQMRRIVLYAAQSVLGRTQQVEAFRYITPYHNCSPPPVFMIIVSIVQIAVYAYFSTTIYDLDQVAAPKTISNTTILPDYSTNDYADFNSTSNLTTLSSVYEDLITSTILYDNSTNEFANMTEEELWHVLCDTHINRDTIATNSYLLLGIPLELVHKVQRIAPIYFLGALLGHFLYLASAPTIGAVGASGAVFALVGAHVANVIINWSEMKFQWLRFAFTNLILLRVLQEVFKHFSYGLNDGVGHLDHIGGFIGGFLLGIVLLRNINIRKWEHHAKLASLAMFIMSIAGCILWIIIYGESEL